MIPIATVHAIQYDVPMVGNRTILGFGMLALFGCGSSEGSRGAGGSGGAAQGSSAGQGGSGGFAGGSSNGGLSNGGVSSGGLSNGGVSNGGVSNGGGSASGGLSGRGGGAGASVGGNAGSGGGGGLPACVGNDDPSAPFVDFVRTAAPAPTPAGGAIASGTYFLTGMTYYGGTQVKTDCILEPMHEVLRVTATTGTAGEMLSTERHQFADGSGQFGNAQSFSYETQGTSLLIDYTCWEPDEYSQPYSATSSQLLFIRGPFDGSCDTGVTLVLTYDKQP